MKKLSIVSLCALVMVFTASHAMAANYAADIVGDGPPFDTEATIATGEEICFDVYLEDAPGQATSGGVWVAFVASTARIAYVSAARALTDSSEGLAGPWDVSAGAITPDANGVGTLQIVVGQTAGGGASPDGDGNIIVAQVCMECTDPGDATIRLRPIPGFSTWGPPANGWDDDAILAATLNLTITLSPGSTTTTLSTDTTTTSTTSIPDTTSSSSTTTRPGLCPVEELYGGDSREAEALRNLRDTVLSKTPEGRELITLYYELGPQMVGHLRKGKEMRQVIDHILLLLRRDNG